MTDIKTRKFTESSQTEHAASISELYKLLINGVWQWIYINGDDTDNPILLYLHGGPGAAEMFNRAAQLRLEKYYTVVNWDQRGAGKSYSRSIPLSTMNVEQFISDTLVLIGILRERFHKSKIYLMGHSWGSLLGMILIQRNPELFAAYIGLGQVVSFSKGETISYQYTLDKAGMSGNRKALAELTKIGLPPYKNGVNGISIQRKWLSRFGGASHRKSSFAEISARILKSKAYNFFDFVKFARGIYFTLKESGLVAEIYEYDLYKMIPEVNIPVYFIAGKYDYNTPWELVEQYCDFITAPSKELIWFENSAHSPNIEETDKFCDVLINIVSNMPQ
jgi:pimeloyl-ACP methyl ester carboxylesterase